MLKAIVSYSKKIPVPESQFSSQGYSLSLEAEITENQPGAIQARLHETFELVKSSVELELANGNAKPDTQGATAAAAKAPSADKASNKQIKFITDISGQRGITVSDLNADIRKRYGVPGLYDLSRKQASDLLDALNGKRKAA
jgi:hypothetical protein